MISARSPAGLAAWQIRRVREFIDGNLGRRIFVRELADVARLSLAHFSRAFERTVGTTPHAFVAERRIHRAQQRMRESAIGLASVAQDCGFSDQAHLTRTFRRVVGMNPGEWRRLSADAT